MKNIFYCINDGNWERYTTPIELGEEGLYTIYYYSADLLNNEEEVKSITVKIDKTAPETTYSISSFEGKNGWHVSNVTIALNASDNASGINATYYRIDEGEWQEYKEEIVVTKQGEHIIEFYSIDNAGNEEEAKNLTVKIDKSEPETIYSISPSSPAGTVFTFPETGIP